jgi:ABC-2 type transport system permease protein
MLKTLLIAWNEFRKQVFRRRFIGTLLFPIFIIAIATAVGYFTATTMIRASSGAIGYVDPDGLLENGVNQPGGDFSFRPFATADEARAALESDAIKAYLTLAPDFLTSADVNVFYVKDQPDSGDLRDAFTAYRNTALLAEQPAEVKTRLLDGSTFSYATPDGARTRTEDELPSFLLPIVMTIFFIMALFGGAQYLMQAVLDEKENRTIEVVITSVTPTQLMAGKILGLGMVGFIQMLVWLVAAAVALALLRERIPLLQNIAITPDFIALALVLFVLQYLLLGAFMAAIGTMVNDAKQGQNYATPFTLLAMAPFFFLVVILFDPNGTLAVLLSLFPFTAPMTLMLRYGMTSVPLWQIGLALVLMALSVAGAMWLAGRIFRVGMLRFDKGVKWGELASSIKF